MKALSFSPEWYPALRFLGKDVENRPKNIPEKLAGQPIALHLSDSWGGSGNPGAGTSRPAMLRALNRVGDVARSVGYTVEIFDHPRTPPKLLTARVAPGNSGEVEVNLFSTEPPPMTAPGYRRVTYHPIPTGAVVGVGWFGRVDVEAKPSPWALPDRVQWPIRARLWLPEPIPCGGALGFWDLPEDVNARVEEYLNTVEKNLQFLLESIAGVIRPLLELIPFADALQAELNARESSPAAGKE